MAKFILPAILIFFLLIQPSWAVSDMHLQYVAGVIYAEAASEDFYAKTLVATTIWVRSDGQPHRIHKVCSLERQYAEPVYANDNEWKECLKLAKSLYNNTFVPKKVILGNGEEVHPDHFFSGRAPWWAKDRIWKRVGRLKFLKLGAHKEV